jgi:hypothetical protein
MLLPKSNWKRHNSGFKGRLKYPPLKRNKYEKESVESGRNCKLTEAKIAHLIPIFEI